MVTQGNPRRDAASGAERAARAAWAAGRLARGEFVKRVGGPARARVIAVFEAVLARNGADTSTISAISPQLEPVLHIGTTKLGLLVSVGLVVGAVFKPPGGSRPRAPGPTPSGVASAGWRYSSRMP